MSTVISGDTGVSQVQDSSITAADLATAAVGSAAPQKMLLTASQATTSGTSVDFTGIPSWAKKITVMFNGVSTNGTSVVQMQVGSGSVVSSGYNAAAAFVVNSAATVSATYSTGFGTVFAAASDARRGHILLTNLSSNLWVASGAMISANGATTLGGDVILSGTLDRIRLTTINGTDTFDAGSVSLLIEGY